MTQSSPNRTTLDRRGFLRRSFAGGAGAALIGSQAYELAAQMLDGAPPLRDIRGVGLDDPALPNDPGRYQRLKSSEWVSELRAAIPPRATPVTVVVAGGRLG